MSEIEYLKNQQRKEELLEKGTFVSSENKMTESERKFAHFFADEKKLIADMDDLTLIAHRDELQSLASEIRARLTSIQEDFGERLAKKNKNKKFIALTEGEDRDLTSEAINNIKERQKKMTKVEKQIENMVENLGISREEAENMFKAANILTAKKGKGIEQTKEIEKIIEVKKIEEETKETKPFVNPFRKG